MVPAREEIMLILFAFNYVLFFDKCTLYVRTIVRTLENTKYAIRIIYV